MTHQKPALSPKTGAFLQDSFNAPNERMSWSSIASGYEPASRLRWDPGKRRLAEWFHTPSCDLTEPGGRWFFQIFPVLVLSVAYHRLDNWWGTFYLLIFEYECSWGANHVDPGRCTWKSGLPGKGSKSKLQCGIEWLASGKLAENHHIDQVNQP